MEYELGWIDPPDTPDDTGPVLPEEVIEDASRETWQRQLVLPDKDGELRLLPVPRARRRTA